MQKSALDEPLTQFAALDDLPGSFIEDAKQYYWPLSRELKEKINQSGMRVIGISGSQGSGKSTLAALLHQFFTRDGLNAVALSLDDFYLTRAERKALARRVHPLLQSRGLPGTHDVNLALDVINQLLTPGSVRIPRFDKATDDRRPTSQWDRVDAPADVLILEGWCLSIPPQPEEALSAPVNDLEQHEDADGQWRRFVNQSLGQDYPPLFQLVDYLAYLQTSDFDSVYRWRGEQEAKLAARTHDDTNRIMNETALRRYIQHFERLTRHSFETLPALAQTRFTLNRGHRITARYNS